MQRIDLKGHLRHDGTFEIDILKCDSILKPNEIANYLNKTEFKTSFLAQEIDREYFVFFLGGNRSYNDSVVALETAKEKELQEKEFELRMTLDSINGVYIPKSLQEAIIQMDALLDFEIKPFNLQLFLIHIASSQVGKFSFSNSVFWFKVAKIFQPKRISLFRRHFIYNHLWI